MEPSIIGKLIGNLDLKGDFSTKSSKSVGTKQKNKNKGGVQIVVNVNGVQTEKRKASDEHKATYKAGYHAIFLDDNQVYFGKLQRFADHAQFMTLKEVYYLQNIADDAVLNVDLVKLGSEIHSPEDRMHINISHVLFWEKLQDNGPIVTAILNHQEK